ncbi:MAG: RebB family R body protein [Thalassospira sp.]|uniref:RebB family R body protein n=1 Tax=Thalassospira sp. TaxID=1912094 RepID=UPI0032EBA263
MPSAPSEQDGTQSQQAQASPTAEQSFQQVSDQITDSVSMTNVATLGVGPGYAALQSMLGQAQSQNVLMANMVSAQKQNAMIGMTTMSQSVLQIMNRRNQ